MDMSNYAKELEELTKEKNTLDAKLSREEIDVGHEIFKSSESSIKTEDNAEYTKIQSDLATKQFELEELLKLEKDISDSENEISQEKKSIIESEKKLDSLLLDLGTALYNNYNSDLASSFGVQYAEISQENKVMEEISLQREALKDELEKQGFFSKLMTQTKIAGLNMSISSHSKKKEESLRKGAKICLENGAVTQENGGNAYIDCANLKTSIESSNNRITLLNEELAKNKQKLISLEKESKINQQIKVLESNLDEVANKIGHAYVEKYISFDGKKMLNFPPEFEGKLNTILEIKKQQAEVSKQYDILKLSEQIDSVQKVIDNICDEIKGNKEKIDNLKEKNKTLQKQVTDTEKEKEDLIAKKSYLEAEVRKDSDSVEN